MEENFNIHLGKKLRMRRLSLGLTQTKVAQAINVTFQQIQKYEKGTNGVSSSRRMQLAQFLKVPITYFYEEYKDYKDMAGTNDTTEDLNYSFLTKTFSSLSKTEKEKIYVCNKLEKNKILINFKYPSPLEKFANITTTHKKNVVLLLKKSKLCF